MLDYWCDYALNGNSHLHWFWDFHICGFLISNHDCVKCVFHFIYGLYKLFCFLIKCCMNECNNVICNIFNISLYNPKNDVCVKWITLVNFILCYIFFMLWNEWCDVNRNCCMNVFTLVWKIMAHFTRQSLQSNDTCIHLIIFSISTICCNIVNFHQLWVLEKNAQNFQHS